MMTDDTKGMPDVAELEGTIRQVTGWPRWRFGVPVKEDITQKVLFELVRNPAGLDGADDRLMFARRIAVRRCIDEVRRQIRERQLVVSNTGEADIALSERAAADPAADPVRTIFMQERARSLARVLENLDGLCRQALQAFYFEGLSYTDMAAKDGIAVNTVGSRLARCVGKLRGLCANDSEMREYFDGPRDS